MAGTVLLAGACFDPEAPQTPGSSTSDGPTGGSTGPGATTVADTTAVASGDASSGTTTAPGTTTEEGDTTLGLTGSTSMGSSSDGVVETCDDGEQNQDETDIDCGGSICDACGDGQACGEANDCLSTVCTGGTCMNYCAEGCPLAGSNSMNTVFVYDPVTLEQVASFAGVTNVQSVAGAPGGLIYAGGSNEAYAIDIATGTVTPIGVGLLSGSLYGTSVGADGRTYYSGSGMNDVRVLEPDGSDGGIVDVLMGSNLRSTTFGPDGSFYLAAFGNDFVERWDPGFIYAGTFSGGGLGSPFGIATRSDGTVVVTSQNNAAFYVYTAGGGFVSSTAVACIGQIRNLAVSADDRLYVGCFGSNRIAVFSVANVEVDSIPVDSPAGVGMLFEWPGPPP
jgi:hypothetical protein